jgi:hypothetical protein
MIMKHLQPILFAMVAGMLLISCFSSKKAQIQDVLHQATSVQQADQKILDDTRAKVDDRLKIEAIDPNIADSIRFKIGRYALDLDSMKNAVSFIDEKINASRRAYKTNKVKIDSSFALIDRYKSRSNYRLRRFTMINESLDIIINQQHMFDLAAFFGPGKYEIPDDRKSVAEKSFSPLIDSLVAFYNRYADIDKKATLVILGYADGAGFNTESEIYPVLIEMLKDSTASKEKLNQKLSELRAINIGNLMEVSLEKKIPNYKVIKPIDFFFVESGKGEEYPSRKITDYKTDDERRRVVLLFWNILPK